MFPIKIEKGLVDAGFNAFIIRKNLEAELEGTWVIHQDDLREVEILITQTEKLEHLKWDQNPQIVKRLTTWSYFSEIIFLKL